MTDEKNIKVITTNRAAFHEYFVVEALEAGIVLTGSEVKSLRAGKVNLSDSFCVAIRGELILRNAQITPYNKGSFYNPDAKADRKLLLHKRQIDKLAGKVATQGMALVPLKLYFKNSLVKVEVALVKGKKLYDKRETIKKRENDRAARRDIKECGF